MEETPLSLNEWIKNNYPEYESIIKEAIDIDRKYRLYINNKYCNVCNKKLNTDDLLLIDIDDFTIVCKDHRMFSSLLNIEFGLFSYYFENIGWEIKKDTIINFSILNENSSIKFKKGIKLFWIIDKKQIKIDNKENVDYINYNEGSDLFDKVFRLVYTQENLEKIIKSYQKYELPK